MSYPRASTCARIRVAVGSHGRGHWFALFGSRKKRRDARFDCRPPARGLACPRFARSFRVGFTVRFSPLPSQSPGRLWRVADPRWRRSFSGGRVHPRARAARRGLAGLRPVRQERPAPQGRPALAGPRGSRARPAPAASRAPAASLAPRVPSPVRPARRAPRAPPCADPRTATGAAAATSASRAPTSSTAGSTAGPARRARAPISARCRARRDLARPLQPAR